MAVWRCLSVFPFLIRPDRSSYGIRNFLLRKLELFPFLLQDREIEFHTQGSGIDLIPVIFFFVFFVIHV